jgi:phosphopantetheine adenylyltransferase
VSPEKIVKKREHFYFEEFVKQWDLAKSLEKYNDFLLFLSYKFHLDISELLKSLNDFVSEERPKLEKYGIYEEYNNFVDKNEDVLMEKFQKENQFQTSVRGLKCRGSFQTQEEAEKYAKKLREIDSNHDIYVGPVGTWIPFDPDAYKTGRVEFMEEELNELHKKKMENEMKAKVEFENRVKEQKRKAIEENIENAKKYGNKLTQTIDENGNLVGVRETVDFESREIDERDKKGVK